MLGFRVIDFGSTSRPVIGVGTYTLIDAEMLLFRDVALMVTWPGAREVSKPLASTFTTEVLEDHQNTRWLVELTGVTLATSCCVVPRKRVVFAGFVFLFSREIETPETWMAGRTTTLKEPYTEDPSVLDAVMIGRGAEEGTAVIPVTVASKTKQGYPLGYVVSL
jgi:hypothetical protein